MVQIVAAMSFSFGLDEAVRGRCNQVPKGGRWWGGRGGFGTAAMPQFTGLIAGVNGPRASCRQSRSQQQGERRGRWLPAFLR